TIVALVTDRARSVPWRFPFDPERGRAAGSPEPIVRADAACWTLAVSAAAGSRPARISVVGTLDGRAMELMTVDGFATGSNPRPQRPVANAPRLRTHTTIGSAWQRRYRLPEMRLLAAPGPGGPIDVWLASPPDATETALPMIVDVHGGPLGAWAPAPSIEVDLLVEQGYRVIM